MPRSELDREARAHIAKSQTDGGGGGGWIRLDNDGRLVMTERWLTRSRNKLQDVF